MSFYFERKIKEIFPINKQIMCFCLIFMAFSAISASAQTKHQRYLDYIERYKKVALQTERDFGVPASITLAQGLLESYVGQSKMALEANNHFGIKAYHWKGEVYGGCDSLKQVGYRKYGAPEDSFLDHAQFLKGPRYSILYQFDVYDYRSWAQGLRDCGYAEDVNYPDKLIRIIEQYELYAINGGKRMDGSIPVQASIDNDDFKQRGAGKATVKIVGTGDYTGKITKTFAIAKAANPLAAKGKTATVKLAKLNNKAQRLATNKVLAITKKGAGTMSYKKVSGSAKIVVSKKTGQVLVKKGLKKGTYAVKVQVTAAGDANHLASALKPLTIKIKVG